MRVALPALFAVGLTVASIAGASARGSLVAEYNFEEGSGSTANDTSGFSPAANGTLTGAPTYTTNSAVGQYALSLNGTSQYVAIGNPTKLQLTGAMTLSAWVRLNSLANQHILSRQGLSGLRGWDISINTASQPALELASNSTTAFSVTGPASSISTGKWYLITGVYDPAGLYDSGTPEMQMYVNGIEVGTLATGVPTSQYNNNQNVNIGTRSEGTSTFLNGLVDDARVYNEALSPAQVAALVPEPASIGAIALAGLGLLLRRRRPVTA